MLLIRTYLALLGASQRLFAKANRSVLVSSYAFFLGKEVLEPLAKLVVDGHTALVTSAHFTEAAHARNIEAGVVVRDAGFVGSLEKQFTSLVGAGLLRRVFP